jgi:polyphosphate kinase
MSRRVTAAAAAGAPARIVVKINALTDVPLIEALIAAGQAGADIDLVVRGACMLPPGVPARPSASGSARSSAAFSSTPG